MVRCNLALLLAERGIKITRASLDTGISRTTLTALSNNYSQGVQFDTLNTLCLYLETTPDKLIAFYPIDLRIRSITKQGVSTSEELDAEIKIDMVENKRLTACYLLAYVSCFYDEHCPCFKIDINIAEPDNIDVFEGNTKALLKVLESIPISFRKDLESKIFDGICGLWPEHNGPILLSFSWPIYGTFLSDK